MVFVISFMFLCRRRGPVSTLESVAAGRSGRTPLQSIPMLLEDSLMYSLNKKEVVEACEESVQLQKKYKSRRSCLRDSEGWSAEYLCYQEYRGFVKATLSRLQEGWQGGIE